MYHLHVHACCICGCGHLCGSRNGGARAASCWWRPPAPYGSPPRQWCAWRVLSSPALSPTWTRFAFRRFGSGVSGAPRVWTPENQNINSNPDFEGYHWTISVKKARKSDNDGEIVERLKVKSKKGALVLIVLVLAFTYNKNTKIHGNIPPSKLYEPVFSSCCRYWKLHKSTTNMYHIDVPAGGRHPSEKFLVQRTWFRDAQGPENQ